MPTVATASLVWSSYQENIFRFVESGKGSAIVEALAGSAKTTTLCEAASRLDEYSDGCAVAFNKRIADELTRRLPAHIPALTFNALGYRAWKRFTDKSQEVDKFKVGTLVKELSTDPNPDFRAGVKRLVDLAKASGLVPSYVKGNVHGLIEDTEDNWYGLIEEYGVDFGWGQKEEPAIELARRVLAESIRVGADRIDFNDQLYLPVIFGADFPRFSILFVDEAQDVSGIQRVIIERSLAVGGRLIAFADRNQAIYHWRGAGADAVGELQQKFGCQTFPLPICYRCSKAVIRKAQQWVPAIQAFAEAPEGLVNEDFHWTPEIFQETDVILCRNNAPLVKTAFRLIRAGRPCKVMGRDIGTGLAALVKKMKAVSNAELMTKLERHYENEIKSMNPDQQSSLRDRIETIRVFTENCSSPQAVVTKIETMFADEAGQYLMLSTVHKAKGLEWPRVFILNPELIGQRGMTQEERNVFYVACTRAKHSLFFIRD